MEQLKTIILFISNSTILVVLCLTFILVYAVSVSANPPITNIVQKLIDGLFSGEVLALLLAGITGFFLNKSRVESERRKEESQELGRLRFKQENQEAVRLAINESIQSLQQQLKPRLDSISDDLQEVHSRLTKIEAKAETALRKAEVMEQTQGSWLSRAEEKISTVLSSEIGHPSLIKNLFYEDSDE